MPKVFYTASYTGKEKYQKYYKYVLDAIEDNEVDLISPEKGNYLKLSKKDDQNFTEKERHYDAIKKGILWADLVIIEISNEDFQLGHEATLAALNKKPVLCLSIFEDFSEKISNTYFFGAMYNEFNIHTIVQEFITKCKKIHLNQRFNLFLSKNQLDYLGKMSKEEGINKSEYLRNLIDEEIRKNIG